MKKLQQWFNQLSPVQQKWALVIFCLVFATLLLLSIRYQPLHMETGSIEQPRIKTDSLKHK